MDTYSVLGTLYIGLRAFYPAVGLDRKKPRVGGWWSIEAATHPPTPILREPKKGGNDSGRG